MTGMKRFGKASARILTIGLMAMGLALGTTALATKSQSAYAYNPKAGGQPGAIQVPVTQGAYQVESVITFPARYAWRSNAYAGTQVITVTYSLWTYSAASGTWQLHNSRAMSAQVAGDGIGSWFSPWTTQVPFGSFAANVQVNWATLDGTVFGWKVIDYNTATDYQCLTANTCSVLPNPSVGAFIYLHPVAPKPVATPQPTQPPTPVRTQPVGGSYITIPGGSDPGYGSASSGGSTSLTFSVNSVDDYTKLFAGAGPQIDDYSHLLGRTPGSGTDPYSQLNQTGAVIAGYQNAANNPYFGQILY